jgi:hypothetical protein
MGQWRSFETKLKNIGVLNYKKKDRIDLNSSNLKSMRNAVSLIVAPYYLKTAPYYRGTYRFNLQDHCSITTTLMA